MVNTPSHIALAHLPISTDDDEESNPPPTENVDLLKDWPDPQQKFENISDNFKSEMKLNRSVNVIAENGVIVHPRDYFQHLRPGVFILANVNLKLSVYCSSIFHF
jgi:hypothetical protein